REQIAANHQLSPGSNTLSFEVPEVTVPGTAAARFRVSSAGMLAPTGLAEDGEVEDYIVSILESVEAPEVLVDVIANRTVIAVRDAEVVVTDSSTDLFAAPLDDVNTLRVVGTDSDDRFELDMNAFALTEPLRVSGEAGEDTLLVTGMDGELDLTTEERIVITGFEIIDLGEDHVISALVDADSARSLAGGGEFIRIAGGEGDALEFVQPRNWEMGLSSIVDGVFLRSAVHTGGGGERINIDFPRPWQNLVWNSDVNNNGSLSPSDALVIINELNRRRFYNFANNELLHPTLIAQFPHVYLDQNGDGFLTPRDALGVINEIARTVGAGEGESTWIRSTDELVTSQHDWLDELRWRIEFMTLSDARLKLAVDWPELPSQLRTEFAGSRVMMAAESSVESVDQWIGDHDFLSQQVASESLATN
ncbi:MAG: GEVED domain-containing protein, partial [Planctomycetota bacterium]